jgi:hypothetical protein
MEAASTRVLAPNASPTISRVLISIKGCSEVDQVVKIGQISIKLHSVFMLSPVFLFVICQTLPWQAEWRCP